MGDNPEKPPPEIPEHELLHRIGRGSYGEVWLARSVTGAHRAVKIIRRDRFESDAPFEREFEGVRQFEEISRGQAGLVDLFLVGRNESAGFFYYVMELAAPANGTSENWDEYEPRTLQTDLKAHGRLPVADCLDLGITMAEALQHLHAHGLVHRDVKPSNLIYTRGRYCRADIGLVTTPNDTETYAGTHGYLPREGAGQPSADVFGLGRVLYEAMTGEDRQSFPALPKSMRQEKPTTAQRELNKVILKTCAHTPEERYANAAALAEDLARIAEGGRAVAVREHPNGLWSAAAVLVLALALSWGFWPERQPVQESKPHQTNQPDEHLLIHWPFEGDLLDASGHGNDARGQWTRPATDRFGQPGRAIAMSAEAFILSSRKLDWPANQPRTVVLWFRMNEWSDFGAGWFEARANGKGTSLLGGPGFALQMTSNGLIGLDGNYICAMFDVGKIKLGRWHFLAVTCAGQSGTARVWLDGKGFEPLDEKAFWWKPSQPFRATSTPIECFGFEGALDEVRVYNRALSEKEIQNLFDTERPAQPTVAGEDWGQSYSWEDLWPADSAHVHNRQNLRRVEEAGGAKYWSPKPNGSSAEVTYQFQFARPVQRAHLQLPIYCVDIPSTTNGPLRGAFAIESSADGKQWHSIYNGLRPSPQWGEGTDQGTFVAEIPKPALGQPALWLRVRLQSEGGKAQLSGAQLGRAPNGANENWKTEPVLRVRLQSP